MKTQEINTALKGFAKQDTNLAKKHGSMMITETKIGRITLNCDDNVFQAFGTMGEELTGTKTKAEMIDWLVDQYSVEA